MLPLRNLLLLLLMLPLLLLLLAGDVERFPALAAPAPAVGVTGDPTFMALALSLQTIVVG